MIVEFECPNCKETTEELTLSRRRIYRPKCPKCNSKMEKIISAPHFKMKGYSYENGYS